MHRFPRACATALLTLSFSLLAAQTAPRPAQAPQGGTLKLPSASPTTLGGPQKIFPELKPYESCDFPDGLRVAEVAPMPPDIHDRPVQMHGVTKSVPLLAGRRVVFAYPGSQPYANVKVELLPPENFSVNRKLLLDDFDDIVASDKHVSKNAARKPQFNGFFIEGLDRDELKTNTLGIYLLIDDHAHIAATAYMLNPEGPQRRFKTLGEYAQMRDTFLYNYTRCIRNNQNGTLFGVSR